MEYEIKYYYRVQYALVCTQNSVLTEPPKDDFEEYARKVIDRAYFIILNKIDELDGTNERLLKSVGTSDCCGNWLYCNDKAVGDVVCFFHIAVLSIILCSLYNKCIVLETHLISVRSVKIEFGSNGDFIYCAVLNL